MSILEIIWILSTIGLIWLIITLFKEDCFDVAIIFIILLLFSLSLMVLHWIDFLTTPLWG